MTVTPPEQPTATFVRFGVPVLILIFYVTASLRFDFTPDSTYGSLISLRNLTPQSLWTALLAFADTLRIDTVIAAKTLSMLFTCIVILFLYLIANEVTRDHIDAFCITIAASFQAWLLQIAPSGSGVSFSLFLITAAIFFLLRNEYIIAAIFAGVASLVAWQNAGLLLIIVVDASINSINRSRSANLIASIVLVFLAVLLPWMLYCLHNGTLLLPNEISLSSLPATLPQVAFESVMLIGLMFVGIVLLALRDKETLRGQTALIGWIVLASFSHERMFILTLPLVLVYAFLAMRKIAETLHLAAARHIIVAVLLGAILAYNQFVVRPVIVHEMREREAAASVIRANAEWIRLNSDDSASVTAPIGYEALVQYYAEKRIESSARFIITRDALGADATCVYDPAKDNPEFLAQHFTVWKRK